MKERQKGIDLGWVSDSRNEIYGLAILWIMLYHGFFWNHFNYSFGLAWLDPLRRALEAGSCGVEVFLFLSGISLYYSFSRNQDMMRFYKRRYRRLLPALWIIAGSYWFLMLIKELFINNAPVIKSFGRFIVKMTQLNFWFGDDMLTWYVAAIAVFYFVYPALYHYLYDDEKKTGRRFAFLFVFSIVAILSIWVSYKNVTYERLERALTRFPIFLLGCGMGKMVHDRKKVSFAWIALPAVLLASAMVIDRTDAIVWMKSHALWRYPMLFIGFSVTMFAGLFFHYISWKPLHRFFRFFGDRSLEFYLSHIILYHLFQYIWGEDPLSFARYFFLLLLSVPVSMLTVKIEDVILSKKPKKEPAPTA